MDSKAMNDSNPTDHIIANNAIAIADKLNGFPVNQAMAILNSARNLVLFCGLDSYVSDLVTSESAEILRCSTAEGVEPLS